MCVQGVSKTIPLRVCSEGMCSLPLRACVMYVLVLLVLVCSSIEASRCDAQKRNDLLFFFFFFYLIACVLKPHQPDPFYLLV